MKSLQEMAEDLKKTIDAPLESFLGNEEQNFAVKSSEASGEELLESNRLTSERN